MRRPGALDLAFNVEALVTARLRTALQLREALGISQQGIYRLVNAEGDRWGPPHGCSEAKLLFGRCLF